MDKISVIMPTYNRGDVIERSVRSVLSQTYKNLELIIVDDGSTDNTEQLIHGFGDTRIVYAKQGRNAGAAHARNTGAGLASGEWIAFQDSDDEWVQDKLEKQMDYWRRHPEYAMVYCPFTTYREADTKGIKTPSEEYTREELEGNILQSILIQNKIGTPTMLMKKESFFCVGGFDESYRCLEDWDFAIRFSQKYSIGFLDEPLVKVYRQEDSLSNKTAEYYAYRSRMIIQYKALLEQMGIFEGVIMLLFRKAEQRGILEPVKNMLVSMLQREAEEKGV